MDFTFTFLKIFFYGLYLVSPLLSFLVFVIVLLGQRVGRKENWTRYDALYWSFITATTVGYGDFKPTRKISKIMAVFIAFTGLIFTGIIVAIALQSALEAFKEVETALAAEQFLQERESYLVTVTDENKKAYDLTMKQFNVGKIDFLDVLIVQKEWLAARIAQLDIAMQRLINRVDLHLALGGSFEEPKGT